MRASRRSCVRGPPRECPDSRGSRNNSSTHGVSVAPSPLIDPSTRYPSAHGSQLSSSPCPLVSLSPFLRFRIPHSAFRIKRCLLVSVSPVLRFPDSALRIPHSAFGSASCHLPAALRAPRLEPPDSEWARGLVIRPPLPLSHFLPFSLSPYLLVSLSPITRFSFPANEAPCTRDRRLL